LRGDRKEEGRRQEAGGSRQEGERKTGRLKPRLHRQNPPPRVEERIEERTVKINLLS
jgi:hypothetical protein